MCTNDEHPLTDLQTVFRDLDHRHRSAGFSYRELRNLFGSSTPSSQTTKCFDSDGDRRYSLAELRSATGL